MTFSIKKMKPARIMVNQRKSEAIVISTFVWLHISKRNLEYAAKQYSQSKKKKYIYIKLHIVPWFDQY
jgi:hypothetical protein